MSLAPFAHTRIFLPFYFCTAAYWNNRSYITAMNDLQAFIAHLQPISHSKKIVNLTIYSTPILCVIPPCEVIKELK